MIEIKAAEALIPENLVPNLGEKALDQIAETLAHTAHDKWMRLAAQDPSSFAPEYRRSIQAPQVMRGTAVISLVGSVANLLEHGAPAQDLRDTLLGPEVPLVPRGQRGKHEAKEGGEYRAIPFRHMTPGAEGRGLGQAMGAAYAGQQGLERLGKEIYGAAKKLKAYGDPEAQFKDRRLEAGLAPKLRDHHATDIYAGMIREEKTYEKATQSKYFTFRTISTHKTVVVGKDARGRNIYERQEATEGWMRKPIQARNYAQKVAAFIQKIAPRAIQALLEGE